MTTHAIFYDLETTDLNNVGQILNFCFIAVDSRFVPLETLKGDVRISRLQLPRAGAILANRVHVIEHQQVAEYSELDAVFAIKKFLVRHTAQSSRKIPLVGYNSAGFDLDYLRTVFIRNGVSPYLNYLPRDLMLLAQALLLKDPQFRQLILVQRSDDDKINLKLERLTQLHGLLDGKQLHESEHDVQLTIALARRFKESYAADVCEFEPYQVRHLHDSIGGTVVGLVEPATRLSGGDKYRRIFPGVLISADERYALWANAEKWDSKQPRSLDCIRFMKYAGNVVLHDPAYEIDPKLAKQGPNILKQFRGLSVPKLFSEREQGMQLQDLEQHIYRLSPQNIDGLARAIHQGEQDQLKNAYQRQLWRRFFLENWEPKRGDGEEFRRGFARYVQYRYGGNLLLELVPEGTTRDVARKKFHPTLAELESELDALVQEKQGAADGDSLRLLEALRDFYRNSEIYNEAKKLGLTATGLIPPSH